MSGSRVRRRNLMRRWQVLDRDTRRALRRAAWRLALVRAGLAVAGLGGTQRWLAARAPAGDKTMDDPSPWQRRAVALMRVSRRIPDTRCLARSLTLWWWMRANGLDPELRMGVRPGTGGIEGHAWVECDGYLFDETTAGAASWSPLDWHSPP